MTKEVNTMIDTDKYEGHTEGPWKWSYSDDVAAQLLVIPNGNDGTGNGVCIGLGDADAQLIADAPLLLQALIDERAEVKRLTKELELYKTRYLKMTEGMDWQEENDMWGNEE